MKLENTSNVIGSSFNNEKKFELNNSPHLFRILSDSLYSNKLESIVRELASNCLDAHVEAGIPNVPFEITLPLPAGFLDNKSSMLVFRDFGHGLSDEQMKTIYTTYCLSTKNNSNDLIGAFGIGSKSPFSYTDSFYVTSIHNGIQTNYNAHINSEGYPVLVTISSKESSEKSGLIVSIPINNEDIVETITAVRKQLNKFKVLPHITNDNIVVNREVYFNKDNFFKVDTKKSLFETDDFQYFNTHAEHNEKACKINVSGILYIVDEKLISKLNIPIINYKHSFVLNAKIGEIDLTASRENIALTKKTEEFIVSKCRTMYTYILNKFLELYKENKWNYSVFIGDFFQEYSENNEREIIDKLEKIISFCNYEKKNKHKLCNILFRIDSVKNIDLLNIIMTNIYHYKFKIDKIKDFYLRPFMKKRIYSFTKRKSKGFLEKNISDLRKSYIIYPSTPLRKKESIVQYNEALKTLADYLSIEIINGDNLLKTEEKEEKSNNKREKKIRVLSLNQPLNHPFLNRVLTRSDLYYDISFGNLESSIDEKTILFKIDNEKYITTFSGQLLTGGLLHFLKKMKYITDEYILMCITENEYSKLKNKNISIKDNMIDSYINRCDEEMMKNHKVDLLLARKYSNINYCMNILEQFSILELKELVSKNNKCKMLYQMVRANRSNEEYRAYVLFKSYSKKTNPKNINVQEYIDKNFCLLPILSSGFSSWIPEGRKKQIKKNVLGYLIKGDYNG